MIKLVIFDLDDTLIDKWGATFPFAINEAVKVMTNSGLKIDSFEDAVNKINDLNSRSQSVPDALTQYLTEINAYDPKYVDLGKKAIYRANFEGKIKPLPGAIQMLDSLKELGVDLALVTKGEQDVQLKSLQIAGISQDKFKKIHIVSDYDKGEAYKEILNDLNHNSSETLVVGDRYETDLLPGKKLGTKVAWIPHGRGKINPPKDTEVDYIVSDLSKLVGLILK